EELHSLLVADGFHEPVEADDRADVATQFVDCWHHCERMRCRFHVTSWEAGRWRAPTRRRPHRSGGLMILACWLSSARAVTTDPGGAVIIGQHSRNSEHWPIMPARAVADKGQVASG